MLIFHVAHGAAWRDALRTGRYEPPSLDGEGFVHLSAAEQLSRTLEVYFEDAEDLVLLAVRPEALSATLRWDEVDTGGCDPARFPHLYGPLLVTEVLHAWPALWADELEGELPEIFARWGLPGHRWVGPAELEARAGAAAVAALKDEVIAAAMRGERVDLSPWGTFKVQVRTPRANQDPASGQRIQLPRVRVLRWVPAATLRTAVASGDVLREGAHATVFVALQELIGDLTWIELPRLGAFDWQRRKQRFGRDPRTGEQIVVPPCWSLGFRMSAGLRDQLASQGADELGRA